MRFLFLLIALLAAACTTKANEAVCCVTEADCARLGVDEPRPCEVGQACKAFACVAAECSTSAECTSPGAPVCADQLCVASCRTDDDCAGAAGGPRCAEDGACVGCFTDADCPAASPFCDADDRRCRGCEEDTECGSGVCIEADAACAEPEQVIHVRQTGVDTGECPRGAPCGTLGYALQKVSTTRKVIHISGGGTLGAPPSTIAITRSVVIDGTDTTIERPPSAPLFSLTSSGVVTIERMRVLGSPQPGDVTIGVRLGSTLRVVGSTLSNARVDVDGGALEISRSSSLAGAIGIVAVDCNSGTVSAREAQFVHTTIEAISCQVNVSRSLFDEIGDGSVSSTGGTVVIENNLVLASNEIADSMQVSGAAPGSRIRFNTFVNTSGVASDGVALLCDGTPEVSSNIFAYGSAHPLGQPVPCPATYSLFDTIAVPEQAAGQGNVIADPATFFINRTARDFHLSAGSPARGAAAPDAAVAEDFDGKARPAPAGSRADAGAFEAP